MKEKATTEKVEKPFTVKEHELLLKEFFPEYVLSTPDKKTKISEYKERFFLRIVEFPDHTEKDLQSQHDIEVWLKKLHVECIKDQVVSETQPRTMGISIPKVNKRVEFTEGMGISTFFKALVAKS